MPKRSINDTMLITILEQVVPLHTVRTSKASPYVLEVDIERAWEELKLVSKWSNEVEVKLYISPIH